VNCETIRVGDVMRTDVATIALDATVADALRSAQRRGIRHLPVMDRGMVVGIISDRDLKRALTGDNREGAGRPVTAADIMTRTVLTVSPNTTVGNACDTMMQEAVSALPVVAGSALIGMITEAEILALFARASDAGRLEWRPVRQ
jgi:acetoin utilization protein AcuB